ncbi:glucan 1,3-beta-glucosidase, partial [Phenoliferia sp. Uapishka_3]
MTIAQEHSFGFSPPNSSPEDDSRRGSMLFDEDCKDGLFDDDKPRKMTGRKGPGPVAADKRNQHNAIERARRESLNGRFMTLAEALPSMANVKRPSKSIIVNKALDFVFDAQVKEHALIKENNELRRQVDQLRSRLGMAPLPPPAPLLASSATEKKPALAQYHQSFASADQCGDEIAHSIGGLGALADSGTSPATTSSPQDTQVTSPTSAPTSPISAFDMSSPTLSYPTIPNMFSASNGPMVGSPSDSNDGSVLSHSLPRHPSHQTLNPAQLSTSPFSPIPHSSNQHQNQNQLQNQNNQSAGGMQHGGLGQLNAQAMLQAQYGFMNPSLLSSQHTALLALHLQQQQQAMQQQHTQQESFDGAEEAFGWTVSVKCVIFASFVRFDGWLTSFCLRESLRVAVLPTAMSLVNDALMQDIQSIADAGLNHVRIPIGYWAFDISAGEPYVQGQYPFLLQAVDWCQNAGLRVIVDVHGAPGSQNGFDNSGRRGTVGWHTDQENVKRTLAVVQTLAAELSEPHHGSVVTAIQLLNEPAGFYSQDVVTTYKQFAYDGYQIVRFPSGSTPSEITLSLHDAFQPLSTWQGFMPPPQFQQVSLDTHIYTVFSSYDIAILWEVQADVYESSASGWLQWAWKAENADDWSYQAGLAGGWIPSDPTQRQFPNQCN